MNQTSLADRTAPGGNFGSHLTVEPIAGALGAEIHGVDLLSVVSDAELAAIRKIWLQYSVVFFRGQPLPPKDFAAFARRFGEVVHISLPQRPRRGAGGHHGGQA